MESLREQQAKNNITHYVEGLPIPVPVNDDDDNNNDNGRRRQISLSVGSFALAPAPAPGLLPATPRIGISSLLLLLLLKASRKSTGSRTPSPPRSRVPYAATLQTQMYHLEKLRTEQEKNNVTHNADRLPIPPPVEQRRSSVTQILGLNKEFLSR